MRNIVFNSFKEKILNGQVNDVIETSGLAVNSKFFDQYDNTDIALEQFRNLEDFKTYSRNVPDVGSFDGTIFEYSSYKVEYSAYEPDDLSDKPIFVNPENSAKFFQAFANDVGDTETSARLLSYMCPVDGDPESLDDLRDTNSGFYYATKKTHLNWLAKRTNEDNNFNNKIRIVLGDDIGNANDMDTIESMFCTTPDRPFNGIFDMNGHKIINKRFVCSNNSNGLIGYLGQRGVVRNGIIENYVFSNQKKISIEKIINDCSDVFAGALVGTNYGTVENIITSGEFRFDGFCPEVYLVNNKYEYTEGDSTNVNSAYNGFFPNKFCINSIYNILPYCGYFNEGIDSTFNDIGRAGINALSGQTSDIRQDRVRYNTNSLLGYMEFSDIDYAKNFNFNHYSEPKMSTSDMFDQYNVRLSRAIPSEDSNSEVNSISSDDLTVQYCLGGIPEINAGWKTGHDKYIISPLIPVEFTQYHLDRILCNSINSIENWETFDDEKNYPISSLQVNQEDEMIRKDFDHGSYLCQQIRDSVYMSFQDEKNFHHQRMNPNARISFYCSPIVGNNFGTIRNIDCRHTIVESYDTFVGFIGNVCGKQNCGTIDTVSVDFSIRNLNSDLHPAESGAANLTRVYSKSKQYKPDYPEDYTNITQVFGYNYDYYQNKNGFRKGSYEEYTYDKLVEDEEYPVLVSNKFYDFHDFVCSGVNREWYDPQNEEIRFTFNKYVNKSERYGNCNFRVSESQSESDIGAEIPEKIRNSKLKFGFDESNDEFKISFKPEEFPSDALGGHYPLQGEVRIFNTYDEFAPGNDMVSMIHFSEEGREEFLTKIKAIRFTVKHFELNYLGDACKSISTKDMISGLKKNNKKDGTEYQLTTEDVLRYARCFNGDCGSTEANAIEFARNLMNSKIAIGNGIFANPYFDTSRDTPDWWEPFSSSANGPFGTTNFGEEDENGFFIPSGVGPNDTNENWYIFSEKEDRNANGPDMCWYMPPASGEYETDGPTAFDTEDRLYNKTYNKRASSCSLNTFCSIKPNGKFDFLAVNNPSSRDNAQFAIQRSMINIEPLQDVGLDAYAKELLILLEKELKIFRKFVREEDDSGRTMSAEERLDDFFGYDWFAKINKINVPVMNRTQNRVYISGSSFEGVTGVTGDYLYFEDSAPKFVVKPDGNGNLEFEDDAYEYKEAEPRLGNLDDMFIDMSILKVIAEEDHSAGRRAIPSEPRYRPYHLIIRLPIRELLVPISVSESEQSVKVQTERCTVNLATWETGELPDHWERNCKFYMLMPAFDPEETNGTLQTFKLRSIYNIGGVAGMINHSEKYEEYGNWNTPYVFNNAYMGSVNNVVVKMRNETMDFINKMTEVHLDEYSRLTDVNDRAIGIASKFAMVAPVFEYHQNEIGTSPDPGISKTENGKRVKDQNTDMLSYIPQCQYSMFQNILLIGPTNNKHVDPKSAVERRDDINGRIYKPFIEWINLCDVLDYNNFFYKRYCWDTDDQSIYTPYTSSNYPECVNIMHNFASLAGDFPADLKIRWAYNLWCTKEAFPIAKPRPGKLFGLTSSDIFGDDQMKNGAPDSETSIANGIRTDEFWQFGPAASETSLRNSFYKKYENVPSWIIGMRNVYDIPDGVHQRQKNYWQEANQFCAHMSPMIDAPNSDYGDINSQLMAGSPNFVFDKLNKTILNAKLFSENDTVSDSGNEYVLGFLNQKMFDLYTSRIENNIRDRYFTWDYDMYPKRDGNDPLDFVIKYDYKKNKRGLWIHQKLKTVDEAPSDSFIRYAMKGIDECINDGRSIHLGYMPSEWQLINIMNRDDKNERFSQLGDEGVAVDGEDFRGILLFEKKSQDLVAMVDGGYGRDITSGCYIADLGTTFNDGTSGYGLLCEIEAE